jgi:hypothetical protein
MKKHMSAYRHFVCVCVLAQLKQRVGELVRENADLSGHQNLRQKIQHLVTLKQENISYKTVSSCDWGRAIHSVISAHTAYVIFGRIMKR